MVKKVLTRDTKVLLVSFLVYYFINLLFVLGVDVYTQNFQDPYIGLGRLIANWDFNLYDIKYNLYLDPIIFLIKLGYQAVFLHTVLLLAKMKVKFVVLFTSVIFANFVYVFGEVINFIRYYNTYSYFNKGDLLDFGSFFSLAEFIPIRFMSQFFHSILIDLNLMTLVYLLVLASYIWNSVKATKWGVMLMITTVAYASATLVVTLFLVFLTEMASL
jgi:hypothetical protein